MNKHYTCINNSEFLSMSFCLCDKCIKIAVMYYKSYENFLINVLVTRTFARQIYDVNFI